MTIDSLKRAARTFIVVFLGLFIPGLLGWLNDLTSWAKGEGATPFPDAHGLAYLLVVAIVAGLIALLNLVLAWLEDLTGVHVLREAPEPTHPAEPVEIFEDPADDEDELLDEEDPDDTGVPRADLPDDSPTS